MYCPDCGNYVDSNFCPNCGCDLRNVPSVRSIGERKKKDYSVYRQLYPNKLEAIKALRKDEGFSLAEAKQILDDLFASDGVADEDSVKYFPKDYKATQCQYDDSIKITKADAFYYADKYYPDKAKALAELLRLGIGGIESRKAIDEAFREIEKARRNKVAPYHPKENVTKNQQKAQRAASVIGKGFGMTVFAAGALGFRILSNLTKMYTKKRR